MLIFDIKQDPPSSQDIEDSKHRQQQRKKFLKSKGLGVVPIILVGLLTLLSILFPDFIGSGKLGLALVGFGLPLFLGFLDKDLLPVGAILVGAIAQGVITSLTYSSVTVGVLLTNFFIMGVIAGIISGKIQENSCYISSLSFIDDPSGQYSHRAESLLKLYKKDEFCRDYMIKVSRQNRSVTVAEADMLVSWFASSDWREYEDEKKEKIFRPVSN